MDYARKSRMRWRGGYTGGEDALEGRMNREERIHCRGGYTVRMNALKGGRMNVLCTAIEDALGGRIHRGGGCTRGEDELR
jgi:hypothetical protein